MAKHIKVVGTVHGEAPEWVREAWHGLVLPLTNDFMAPNNELLKGVLSQKFVGVGTVYPVPAKEALDILSQTHSFAYRWWWANAHEYCVNPSYILLFNADACELVEMQ